MLVEDTISTTTATAMNNEDTNFGTGHVLILFFDSVSNKMFLLF